MFVSMSQLFEDVKASRVSYGLTSMIHSQGLLTITYGQQTSTVLWHKPG